MVVTRHTPVDELPQLLTIDEVCTWLDIGRSLGYDLVRREEISSIRLGRLVRVPRAELAKLGALKGESS